MGRGGYIFLFLDLYMYIYMYIEKYFTNVFKEVDMTRYFDQWGRYFIFETGHNRLSHFLTEGSFVHVLGICTLHTVFPSPIQGCDEDNCECQTCSFVPCLVFTGEKGIRKWVDSMMFKVHHVMHWKLILSV